MAEYYALLLFATVGMLMMAGSNELMMIFLGLEILSIATYVLAGFRRTDLKSNESALKYFLLGSFSSAFFLYGTALIFGATGSTNLRRSPRRCDGLDPDQSGVLVGRIDADRPLLQGRGCAIPHLDTRCLRRSADARHGFHVGWTEGRGICGSVPRFPDGVPHDSGPMGSK